MSTAAHSRAYRERKRRGKRIIKIEVDHGEVADQLVEGGILGEWDSENPDAVRSALMEVLARGLRHQ
ncbi:MAG: hypothetical protein ACTHM2_06500 [Afipia sp.]